MFREISKVEAMECCGGASVVRDEKGRYGVRLNDSELLLKLPPMMPIAKDDRPFPLRETANNDTDPELPALITTYPGVGGISIYGGIYDGQNFLLTEPFCAKHLLVIMFYDVEASKEARAEFACKYNACWYHYKFREEADDNSPLFRDDWIIPRTPEFEELLQRHHDNFCQRVEAAEKALAAYDAHRDAYRQYAESELLWRVNDLGWKLYLYDVEARLLYVNGWGGLDEMVVRYDRYGVEMLEGLIYIAEELAENGPDESSDGATEVAEN